MHGLDPKVAFALFPLLNNLYFVHRDIVEVCQKWVLRRSAPDEQRWLATQLAREVAEVDVYLRRVKALDVEPNPGVRIRDSATRYQVLKDTEDGLEMVIGMNVVAQGALGIVEHEQLYQFAPEFLGPEFFDACVGMTTDLEYAKQYLRRRDRAEVERQLARYYRHLIEVTVPAISPLLDPLAKMKVFRHDIIEEGRQRFLAIAKSVGCEPSRVIELSASATPVVS